MTLKSVTKSPIHWIGGKKKMLKDIIEHLPPSFNNYFEPFLGSGIVFINLPKSASSRTRSYINDYNTEIINIFRCIRDFPNEVISKLHKMERDFISTPSIHRKNFFIEKRSLLNELLQNKGISNKVERACHYIFVNKTSFSGVMQANRKGNISSSFGHFTSRNPKICNGDDILLLSKQLQQHKTSMYDGDYRKILKKAQKGDFIFLDPPYVPDPHIKYTVKYQRHGIFSTTKKEDGWQKEDFEDVITTFKELDSRGCKVMMTNFESTFIRKECSSYTIIPVESKRKITSKMGKNKNVQTDILIMNY